MKRVLILFIFLLFDRGLLAGEPPGSNYEQSLLDTIKEIQSQNHDQALSNTRELIRQYPHSRLGQMLYADLLLAKAEPLQQFGSGIDIERATQDFRYEIQQRWQNDNNAAHQGLYPENIVYLSERQPYVILVDQQSSRIYVYRNDQGRPVLEADYFTTIGLKGYGKEKRGDQKTPIGVYHITHYIDGTKLPDLYGDGAFPINYPNSWDLRQQRTGDGIWIHGTPSYTYNRSPWASNGCIVVSNPDFRHFDDYVKPGLRTPVIVAQQVNWVSEAQWQKNRADALALINGWAQDWSSLDHERYRKNYSPTDFKGSGRTFSQWDKYKRNVNRNKTRIEVGFDDLNMFRYPGEAGLILMQFEQSYRSNNLDADTPKEIYWRQFDTDWKIVYEGIRKFPRSDREMAEN